MDEPGGWSAGVLDALRGHVFVDRRTASAGVLVGQRGASGAQIEGVIPTLTGGRAGADPIDHERWGRVHEALAAHYPGRVVLGWYVARPGLDARVTEGDIGIHSRFFPKRSQLLLAVDPTTGDAAAYSAVEGGLTLLSSGNIAADVWGAGDHQPLPNLAVAAGLGGVLGLFIWLLTGAGAGPFT